jgi:glycosyltransferase involved in cell wall biosynthesis
MNILFVQRAQLGRHGMADAFYYQIKLAELGHSVMVMAAAGGDASAHIAAGIRVLEVERGRAWLGSLRKAARDFQPDIVHVFIHAGCGLYPLVMKRGRKSGTKFVLDIRSPLLRKGMLRKLVQFKNRLEVLPYHAIFTHSIASGRSVIGDSRGMILTPPGVDFSILPALAERGDRVLRGGLKLVYVGSMDVKRKLHNMVQAVMMARQTIELSLDLYGDGNAMPGLMQLVKGLGAESYIHFKGRIERARLFECIPEYHAGLSYIPGDLYDAAPALKTLEYLACGIPVLATSTSGNRLFIEEGRNGVLVGEEAPAFAEGIKTLVNSGVLDRAATALRDSIAGYDWNHIASEIILPEYRKLLVSGSEN